MSLPRELEELQNKRTKLEDESRSLKDERKKLEERAKALEQEIIEELGSMNEEARQNISRLESVINDLELRRGHITQETATKEPIESASQAPNLKATEGASVEIKQTMVVDTVENPAPVITVGDSSSTVGEWNSESHQDDRKKKRNFWEKHSF